MTMLFNSGRATLVRLSLFIFLAVASPDFAQAQINLDREPLGPSSRRTGLAITEIMYNPRPVAGQATNFTLEFIEVFNSKPWNEDLSGCRIEGSVRYVFPEGTILPSQSFLVVARVPGLVRTNYSVTNVFGPWDGASTNRLPTERGLVQFRNRLGAVLLEVNYQDSPPWPESADGTGHSLSLARPSYGENDFRAWSQSDSIGGSPGGPDPFTPEALASVLINEWQNHSDPVDWIELYNHGNLAADVSGAWLSDDPTTNKFRIPNGTSIPPRGFIWYDQIQLGFELFAGGETIFFVNSNRTRVIDVIDFRGQSNNVSSGRSPDGGPLQYGLATRTPGAPNSPPMRYPVVISEIMFNPISGSSDDEYIEIHNRSSSAVSLAGWEFVVGINYNFPTNPITTSMPAGAYWVLAKNPTNLMAIYTNLTANNTFGPYDGTLANGGERVTFAAADYDIVGAGIIEKLNVPVSNLIYDDGGKWGHWSDGQGSSLELIDVESDPHHPSNWADGNDTGESQWTAIEYFGPLGETLGSPVNDSVIIMLQGIGECLVDEVEVRADHGPNLVANGGFESGLNNWTLQGSHDFSTVANEGFDGSKSLHVRAASRGDNQSNRILSAPFASPIPSTAQNISIRAKVRWLRGHPEVLVRLHGSATEAYGRLALPRRLGSPGTTNSRRIANAGPAIYNVKHFPILPSQNEPVLVTALASDRQGLSSMNVRYRIDPAPLYSDLAMRDNGTFGDVVANDGVYSAIIPGQSSGSMVAFYIEGRDSQNAVGTFPQEVFPQPGFTRCWPTDAIAHECVVRWGEAQMPGDFATYHLWVTAVNSNRWHIRDTQNNTPMAGTFVYNNSRVIYNALPLYSGSPWHRTNATAGPAGPHRVDYEMNFPDDEPLLGATDFVLNNPGNPDIFTITDRSALAEQTVYKIFEGLGMPNNHRRYIHFFVNGSQRSTAYERPGNFIFEDSQQPNGDLIAQWFPNDAGGQLFKVEDWFEFDRNGFDIAANNDADLVRRTVLVNGQETFLPGPYRFMFRKRSVGVGNSANDYSLIYSLIDAVSPAADPAGSQVDPEALTAMVDWEEWMRHFAVQRAVGNWDSYGWERGKNDYLYKPANGGFRHLPWDIDYSLGLGRPANEPLFASNDPRIAAMLNTPAILRAYWRAFSDLVSGPFDNSILDPFIDARVAALVGNNINIDLEAVAAIKLYITERRTFLQGQLATVSAPFTLDSPVSFSTTNNLLILSGTAPVAVKDVTINGAIYPVTWISATSFRVRIALEPGINTLVFEGRNRFGVPVLGASQTITPEYIGPVVNPVGALVITEVMASPSSAAIQFIEIINRSSQVFGLSGWSLDGANFTFPPGSIITNGQTIVLARNRTTFTAAYGPVPVFAVFPRTLPGGETLALVRPDGLLVDGVRYEPGAPWPQTTHGVSLQLVDPAQDNDRASNWAIDPVIGATPGASNSVTRALLAYDPLWLNELQVESLNGPMDNMGESEPWLEIYNAGLTPLSLDTYFLATNYSGNLTDFAFPPGILLAPGEHKLIWLDGEPSESTEADPHTGFRIETSGRLALVRFVAGQPQIVDHLTWDHLGANLSYGGASDGQAVYRFNLHTPSSRTTNAEPARRVFINEWMTRNSIGIRDPADNSQDDWFELYNAENFTVDLSRHYLTDDTNNPTKYQVPNNGQYRIAPRSYLLIWADNQTNQNTAARADLHVNFQLSSSPGVIALYRPDSTTSVDTISYAQQTPDISEGRYSDGASARYFMTRSTPRGTNSHPTFNSPPRFPVIPTQFLLAGWTNTLNIRATDPDGHVLTYELVDTPPGTQLNPSGLVRWIVPTNQAPGDYSFTLRVTDNGTPSRSDVLTFIMRVLSGQAAADPSAPLIHSVTIVEGEATFSIDTIPGRTYRAFYSDNLENPNWFPLDRDFVAANPIASITDTAAVPQRFYRVLRLD